MEVGKVKWFSDAKGYGFILSPETSPDGKDIFVHYTEILKEGFRTLTQGQEVRYELVDTPKGLQAKQVEAIQVEAIVEPNEPEQTPVMIAQGS